MAKGNVTAEGNTLGGGQNAGGLVGKAWGTSITNSLASGDVAATRGTFEELSDPFNNSYYVGGLVGYAQSFLGASHVENSFADRKSTRLNSSH